MKKAILATKVGMTQIFNEDGVLTPVTVLEAGPCVVTQVKTVDNDGYDAIQVATRKKRVFQRTFQERKLSETHMAQTRLRQDTSRRQELHLRDL